MRIICAKCQIETIDNGFTGVVEYHAEPDLEIVPCQIVNGERHTCPACGAAVIVLSQPVLTEEDPAFSSIINRALERLADARETINRCFGSLVQRDHFYNQKEKNETRN